jgi:hypothetical protein
MKIPLKLKEEIKNVENTQFIERRIILPVNIIGRKIVGAEFIIDTGCPYSFINYITLLNLNLPKNECKVKKMVIGGSLVDIFSIPTLKLYLKTEKGEIFILKTDCLNVAMPSEANEKEKAHAYTLPNILGLDFLIHHKLKLFLNLSENVQYLEV